MKNSIIYIITIFCISALKLNAQIGINTENPQTLFHIDVLKNNTGTTPSTTQQLDDVYMGLGYNNEAVLSIGALPQNNTQLLMTDNNKAFSPNIVSLTSHTDITTVPNPQTGMLVYNTATVTGTSGVIPGLYVYENNKWQYLFTEDIKKLQMRSLQTATQSNTCASTNYACAALMDFGDDIIIPQAGAYGVGVSLYGKSIPDLTAPKREIVYIWLMANDTPVDVAELNIVGFEDAKQSTYTVFLGGAFNAGDKLTCRISTNNTVTNGVDYLMYFYPTKTFMMYWRLEQVSSIS